MECGSNKETLKVTLSENELSKLAKKFCVNEFGTPLQSVEKDKWMERYGFLLCFVSSVFENPKID